MNDDRSSRAAANEGRQAMTWLERIGQALQGGEPKDKDDILQILRDASSRDILSHDAVSMIHGVLQVAEMQVRDIMIPRSQMVVLSRDGSLDEFVTIINDSAHSRFPVIGENRDEVLGILLAKDLLPYTSGSGRERFDIREILRPAFVVPESKRLNTLLTDFRTSRNHMAIVVDEYGGVAGLVTIEDVLEEIVGDIEDEHDVEEDEHFILANDDGTFSVKALTSVEEFNEYFDCDFSDEEFDTIGGLILGAFGRLPKRGESIELGGFLFNVVRADNRRIYHLEAQRCDGGNVPDETPQV